MSVRRINRKPTHLTIRRLRLPLQAHDPENPKLSRLIRHEFPRTSTKNTIQRLQRHALRLRHEHEHQTEHREAERRVQEETARIPQRRNQTREAHREPEIKAPCRSRVDAHAQGPHIEWPRLAAVRERHGACAGTVRHHEHEEADERHGQARRALWQVEGAADYEEEDCEEGQGCEEQEAPAEAVDVDYGWDGEEEVCGAESEGDDQCGHPGDVCLDQDWCAEVG